MMKHFSPSHDYILVYAKQIDNLVCHGIARSAEANARYSNPDKDPRGVWKSSDLSVGPAVEKNIYPITTPSGRTVYPPSGYSWRLSQKVFEQYVADNRIWFGSDGNAVPSIKRFLHELKKSGITPMTFWRYEEVGHSQAATQFLMELFDNKKVFDYPKPIALIKRCIELYADPDSIILDFFSGSATTAHAVMEMNANDNGHRKYILVQLPELVGEGSVAFQEGYKNICKLAIARIKKAKKKIEEEYKDKIQNLDFGFRVMKLDSSNMQQVWYTPTEYVADDLFDLTVDNVKPDRDAEDLLFQAILEHDCPLSSKIESFEIDGRKVFSIAEGYLMACFSEDINDNVISEIAKKKPYYFVMRDSSMANDSVAVNFEQIFKSYSPDTKLKVF